MAANRIYYTRRGRGSGCTDRIFAVALSPSMPAFKPLPVVSGTWSSKTRRELSKLIGVGEAKELGMLPWAEPRAMLEFGTSGLVFLAWNLGLRADEVKASEPRSFIKIEHAESELEGTQAQISRRLANWATGGSLRHWAKKAGGEANVDTLIDLLNKGEAIDWVAHDLEIAKPSGELVWESGLPYLLARELAGKDLLPGLPGFRLVVSPALRGTEAELMTDPQPFKLDDGKTALWSARARLIVQRLPQTNQLILQALPRKRIWVTENPPKQVFGKRNWTGYFYPRGRKGVVVPRILRFNAQWDGADWVLGGDFASLAIENELQVLSTASQVVQLPTPIDPNRAWAGMAHSTLFGGAPLGRTMTEVDEEEMFEAVRSKLGDWVEKTPVAFRSIEHRSRMVSSGKMLGLSGLLHAATGSTEAAAWTLKAKQIIPGIKEIAADPKFKPEEVAATRQLHATALAGHHDKKPILWVLHKDNIALGTLIKAEARALFGDTFSDEDVRTAIIPGAAHVEREKGKAQSERFSARVDAWKPTAQKLQAEGMGRPAYAIICAPKFIGNRPEDAVNCPAAIHALALHGGINAHYVLPVEGKSASALTHFAHRVQSALSDLLLAHNGHLADLPTLVGRLPAVAKPSSILGMTLVQAEGSRRLNAGGSVIAATRFTPTSKLMQVRFAFQDTKGKQQTTGWMSFRDGLRFIASQGPVTLGDSRTAAPIITKFISETVAQECQTGRPLVLVDPTGLSEVWTWLQDAKIGEPVFMQGYPDLRARWKSATVVRVRSGDQPPLRAIMSWTYAQYTENLTVSAEEVTHRYPTTTTRLAQVASGPDGGHYLGVHKYTGKTQVKRGLSGYRTMEVFGDADVPGLKEPRVRVPFAGFMQTDMSVPASIGITVGKLAEGMPADDVASVVLELRLGYGHTPDWTSLPAPLFFARKIKDYFVPALIKDEGESAAQATTEPANEPDVDTSDGENEAAPTVPVEEAPAAADVKRSASIEPPHPQVSMYLPGLEQMAPQEARAAVEREVFPLRVDELLRVGKARSIVVKRPSFIDRKSIERAVGMMTPRDVRDIETFLSRHDIRFPIGRLERTSKGLADLLEANLDYVGTAALIGHVLVKDSRPRQVGRDIYRAALDKYMSPQLMRRGGYSMLPTSVLAAKDYGLYAELMFWAYAMNYREVARDLIEVCPEGQDEKIDAVLRYLDEYAEACAIHRSGPKVVPGETAPATSAVASAPATRDQSADPASIPNTDQPVAQHEERFVEQVPTPNIAGQSGRGREQALAIVDTALQPDSDLAAAEQTFSAWLRAVKHERERAAAEKQGTHRREALRKDWEAILEHPVHGEIAHHDSRAAKILDRIKESAPRPESFETGHLAAATKMVFEALGQVKQILERVAAIDATPRAGMKPAERVDLSRRESEALQALLDGIAGYTETLHRAAALALDGDELVQGDAVVSPPELIQANLSSDATPGEDAPIGSVVASEAEEAAPPEVDVPPQAPATRDVETSVADEDDEIERFLAEEARREERIADAFARMLSSERFGVAALMARAAGGVIQGISSDALEALAGGCIMTSATASDFADAAIVVKPVDAVSTSLEWEKGPAERAALLSVLTACIRPALFMPTTTALSLVRSHLAGSFGSAQPLHRLVTLLDEDIHRLPDVNAGRLRLVLAGGRAVWEERLKRLCKKAAAWEDNPDLYRGFKYPPALHAHRKVLATGPLHEALVVIGTGDQARMKTKIDAAIAYLEDDMDALIDRLAGEGEWKRYSRLQATQRDRVQHNYDLAIAFLKEVAAHLNANPAVAKTANQQFEDFATKLRGALDASIQFLGAPPANETILQEAIRNAARDVLASLLREICDGDDAASAELRGYQSYVDDDLLLTRLQLCADLRPDPYRRTETVSELIDDDLAKGPRAKVNAQALVDEHLQADRLIAAQVLSERKGLTLDRGVFEDRRRKLRVHLGTVVENARSDIAIASAMSALNEETRRDLELAVRAVFDVSTELPLLDVDIYRDTEIPGVVAGICDFRTAHRYLQVRVSATLAAKLNDLRRLLLEDIRDFMSKAPREAQGALEDLVGEVSASSLTFTGAIAADEQLRAIRDGNHEPPENIANIHLRTYETSFLPKTAEVVDIVNDCITKLQAGERPGYQLRDLTAAERARAIEMLRTYQEITKVGPNPEQRAPHIKRWFTDFLEVNIGAITLQKLANNPFNYRIDQASLPPADFVPPQFGSQSRGHFFVRVTQGKAKTDGVLNNSMATDHAGFGFVAAQLDSAARRHVAKEARRGNGLGHALPIDCNVAVHLALNTDSPVKTLLGVVVPLLRFEPYQDEGLTGPEMFFGRTDMMREIRESKLGKVVYGGRRTGKSSMLQAVCNGVTDDTDRYIYVDSNSATGERYERNLCEAISGALRATRMITATGPKADIASVLAFINDWLDAQVTRRFTLILDESEKFVNTDRPKGMPVIERLTQNAIMSKGRFRLVLAGLHNVMRLVTDQNSQLPQFGTPIGVQPFLGPDMREGVKLICKPLAAFGFEFEKPSLAHRILAVTNYYPAMIQEYCRHLLKHLHRRPQVTLPYKITTEDLNQVEGSTELADALREKLQKNLQMAPVYNLIVHIFVLEQLTDSTNRRAVLSLDKIVRDCLYFAPTMFPPASPGGVIGNFVDEMVNLAILTRVEGGFMLRSPALASNLGSAEVILNDLQTIAANATIQEAPSEHRVLLAEKETLPLQRSQFIKLFNSSRETMVIVVGTARAGIDRILQVPNHKALTPEAEVVVFKGRTVEELTRLAAQRDAGEARKLPWQVMLVPSESLWNASWLRTFMRHTDSLRKRKTRVVFLGASAEQAMDVATNRDLLESQEDVAIEYIAPWSDSAIQQYAAAPEVRTPALNVSPADVEALYALTGGLGPWIEIVVQRAASSAEISKPTANALSIMNVPKDREGLCKVFGIGADVIPVLQEIKRDPRSMPEVVKLLADKQFPHPNAIGTTLIWTGALVATSGGALRVNPLLAKQF